MLNAGTLAMSEGGGNTTVPVSSRLGAATAGDALGSSKWSSLVRTASVERVPVGGPAHRARVWVAAGVRIDFIIGVQIGFGLGLRIISGLGLGAGLG